MKHDSEPPTPAADEATFITLIRTAQQDPAFGRRLRAILAQPPFHRKSILNTMLDEMRLTSAPPDLIAAAARLLDDAVAAETLKLLE